MVYVTLRSIEHLQERYYFHMDNYMYLYVCMPPVRVQYIPVQTFTVIGLKLLAHNNHAFKK